MDRRPARRQGRRPDHAEELIDRAFLTDLGEAIRLDRIADLRGLHAKWLRPVGCSNGITINSVGALSSRYGLGTLLQTDGCFARRTASKQRDRSLLPGQLQPRARGETGPELSLILSGFAAHCDPTLHRDWDHVKRCVSVSGGAHG